VYYFLIALFYFFFGTNTAISQINLRSSENFSLYTSNGAISNENNSNITCDIGTDAVAVTGFGSPSIINGAQPDNSGIVTNLEIPSGASLTINDNSLRVTTNLKLNGRIDLEGNSQLL
jgi:hypothetical protein